ncbi:MAG: hypothetical protein Q4D54_05025, partial [Eubacteriales bacterium]|nr:hypothetical protein [Eubacteriales bacterium]
MYQMPQGQPMYQMPQMASDGIGGYFSSLTGNIMNLVRAIGALILLISPILPWAKVSFFGMKESANMFKIGGIEGFFAVMIVFFAVVVVLWDMADHVPALGNIKAKLAGIPFMELILAGVLLLFVLFGTIKSTAGTYGLAKKAIGVWIAWIGVVAVAVPGVMKLVKK